MRKGVEKEKEGRREKFASVKTFISLSLNTVIPRARTYNLNLGDILTGLNINITAKNSTHTYTMRCLCLYTADNLEQVREMAE